MASYSLALTVATQDLLNAIYLILPVPLLMTLASAKMACSQSWVLQYIFGGRNGGCCKSYSILVWDGTSSCSLCIELWSICNHTKFMKFRPHPMRADSLGPLYTLVYIVCMTVFIEPLIKLQYHIVYTWYDVRLVPKNMTLSDIWVAQSHIYAKYRMQYYQFNVNCQLYMQQSSVKRLY